MSALQIQAIRLTCVMMTLLAWVLPCGMTTTAYAVDGIRTVESARFVLSERKTPPNDDAPWADVSLPHDWRTLNQSERSTGWYRIDLTLDAIPAGPQGIYLRHLRAYTLELHVNGVRHVGSRDIHGAGARDYGHPLHALVPPALWKQGNNVLHFRMSASPRLRNLHGLGRVHVGPLQDINTLQRNDADLTGGALRLSFAAALTAGLIVLFLWFANRSDRVMFWFSLGCLTWAAANIPNFWLRFTMPQWAVDVCNFYVQFGLPVPAFILALRLVDLRWPRLERWLAVFLLLECTFFLWVPLLGAEVGSHWLMRVFWPTASALLLFWGALIIMRHAPRPLRWSHYLEQVSLVVMGALLLQDLARYMGWVDLEPHIIRVYHVPVMVLAIGLVIFERHVAALWRVERAKAELEQRVAAAASEIEQNHQRMEAARREQTLAAERQRILADMHDGLGASLVELLHHVQSHPADAPGIEQRVKSALQEMRIAIDALEPAHGDLATVLGNLRYRLAPLMQASGVNLAWDVAEMPKIEALDPSAVFTIQRAVLEALFNALKHSGAKEIRLAALPRDEDIEISIEDDGQGFDPTRPSAGIGLGTMRERAARLGGQFNISSHLGDGTRVTFHIPYTLASAQARPETTEGHATNGMRPSSIAV